MHNILIAVGALFLINSAVCDEDILQLSDEEYYQLPDLFVVENYEKCLSQRGNAFCAGTFELTAPAPSTLYDLLKQFSANERENFNHTRVHRAICVGPKTGCTIKGHLKDSFQECINKNMLTEYGLNAELANFFFCRRSGEELTVDGVDRAFIAYLGVIVLLNSMGTAYHFFVKEKGSKGNRWLMAFSLFDNWKRLSSPSESGDPRLKNFACFNGIKALSMVLVHMAHAPFIIIVSFMANPRFAESTARRPEMVLVYSGTVIVQSFILVTNFLIGYRLLLSSEKCKMSLSLLPKLIIDRIFRIYPIQLTAIGITATVAVHLCDGPLWRKYVTGEALLCRETWWHHALFIHNFFAPKCIPQSWYISTDIQLYIISSIVMLWILGRGLDPEYVLKRLLAASVLGVFVGAYTLDLKPSLTAQNPEALFTVYANERSFRLLYQSFWGNLPSAIMGLLFASIYYRLEKEKVDLSKNKTFVLLHQSAMPLGWIWTLMGYFFVFSLRSRFSTSLYATIDKPVFATIISFIAMGCIYKIKGPSNAILSWPGWLVPSRLSLGALMLHVVVNKQITLSRIHSSTLSITSTVADWFAVSIITYLVVTPLALLVEYPFIQLYKIIRDSKSVRRIETEPKCVVNENNNIVEKDSKHINCKSKDL